MKNSNIFFWNTVIYKIILEKLFSISLPPTAISNYNYLTKTILKVFIIEIFVSKIITYNWFDYPFWINLITIIVTK